jgi:hypothetical protein
MAFRTQKISQMTPKGADLEATDLIEVSTIESGSYVTRSITGQELIDAIPLPPTGLTVGTTPIASGTIGRVLFQGTGNVLQQSGNLFWDEVNGRVGIGTSTPSQALAIANGNITLTSTGSPSINIGTGGYPKLSLNNRTAIQEEGPSFMSIGRSYSNIGFYLSNVQIAGFASTGNLLINTTTDAGFRLDVNGTARFTSSINISGGFVMTEGGNVHTFTAPSTNRTIRFITNSQSYSLFPTGNFAIGTTTDAGFRLDVNGDTRLGSGTTTGTTEVRGSNIVIFRVNDVLNNNNMGIYKNATSGYLFESSSANQLSYGYASNYWMSWRNSTKSIAIASTGSEPTPAATAIFDLQSTTKGFLPPRMTTTQRNAIASPAAGLMVYDTTLNAMFYFNGTIWI